MAHHMGIRALIWRASLARDTKDKCSKTAHEGLDMMSTWWVQRDGKKIQRHDYGSMRMMDSISCQNWTFSYLASSLSWNLGLQIGVS